MGACFSKVFNGCPLHINCTASWINPETRDQHIIIGADEGIFTLNMNEIHDAVIDQIYPRKTIWLYVIKDVLMSLSGKSSQLYRHDLVALHSKQATSRFTLQLHMQRIPEWVIFWNFLMSEFKSEVFDALSGIWAVKTCNQKHLMLNCIRFQF